jgi:hypothetical protein
MQHNSLVSSKSPQKELDLSPPNSGLFFRLVLPQRAGRRLSVLSRNPFRPMLA